MAKEPAKRGPKGPRRPIEERAAAAELEARRLRAQVKAGDDENVQGLLATVRSLARINTLGHKAADEAVSTARKAIAAAMQALGI